MTYAHPPRWAERLLAAAGGNTEFADEVLGDMAEEYLIRAAYDGAPEAQRWYLGEGLRTVPHLVRHWLAGLRKNDARHLFAVILESYFVVGLAGLTVTLVAGGVLSALGINLGAESLPATSGFIQRLGIPGVFLVATTCSLVGGYYAAMRGRRAPIASAVGLGLWWLGVAILALVLLSFNRIPVMTPPLWTLLEMPLVLAGTFAGGLIRVATEDEQPAEIAER